jgi:hypothetical protein
VVKRLGTTNPCASFSCRYNAPVQRISKSLHHDEVRDLKAQTENVRVMFECAISKLVELLCECERVLRVGVGAMYWENFEFS